MTIMILELSIPAVVIVGLLAGRVYLRYKYPTPRALGRVLRELCVVDADEILQYNELLADEWEAKPHMRANLRKNQVRVYSAYYVQMGANAFCFQQVARFEDLKIDPGKSSFDYDTREVLVTNLIDETARLRSEIFEARVDLLRRALLRGALDKERLQALLGKYKALEHEMVELANMAKDTTCRDMLIERLGLSHWRIFNGGSAPESP